MTPVLSSSPPNSLFSLSLEVQTLLYPHDLIRHHIPQQPKTTPTGTAANRVTVTAIAAAAPDVRLSSSVTSSLFVGAPPVINAEPTDRKKLDKKKRKKTCCISMWFTNYSIKTNKSAVLLAISQRKHGQRL